MDQFRKNFKSHKYVKIPQPIHALVTNSVLVETFEVSLTYSVHCKLVMQCLLIIKDCTHTIIFTLFHLYMQEGVHISQYVKGGEQASLKKRIASLGIDVLLNMVRIYACNWELQGNNF